MELQETTAQGALRETDEEAGAEVTLGELFSLINVDRVGQVHFFYTAQLQSTQFNPGHETMATQLVAQADVPWGDIAFRTVKETLERFFAHPPGSAQKLHHFDV
jgi:ADP-ribose pyrophosphatase YjhB (NUDIX family)